MKKFFIVELTIKQGERENLLKYLNSYAVEVRKEDGCECLDVLGDPVQHRYELSPKELEGAQSCRLKMLNLQLPNSAELAQRNILMVQHRRLQSCNAALKPLTIKTGGDEEI